MSSFVACLVHLGCWNKTPGTRWFMNNKRLFLTVGGLGSPRSWHWRWGVWRGVFTVPSLDRSSLGACGISFLLFVSEDLYFSSPVLLYLFYPCLLSLVIFFCIAFFFILKFFTWISFLKIIFHFSITLDIQAYVSFKCPAQWLDIYIPYKVITPINLISIWHHI